MLEKMEDLESKIRSENLEPIFRGLAEYLSYEDFIGDEIRIDRSIFVIQKANFIVGLISGQWLESSLNLRRRSLLTAKNIILKIFIINDTKDRISIMIFPDPFHPMAREEISLFLRIELVREDHVRRYHAMILDCFPDCIHGYVQDRKVREIIAFSCPCAFKIPGRTKIPECKHMLWFTFEDGSSLCGSNEELTVDEIRSKGYLPYLYLYAPNTSDAMKRQIEGCKLCPFAKAIKHGEYLSLSNPNTW